MGLYRLYSGADGESHVEALKLVDHPELKGFQVTTGLRIQEFPAKQFLDWRPARRQYVIILSGEPAIGLGDGTLRRFGSGDARLVEDTRGRGHTTRTLITKHFASLPGLQVERPY
jgi:hypothetical protein